MRFMGWILLAVISACSAADDEECTDTQVREEDGSCGPGILEDTGD